MPNSKPSSNACEIPVDLGAGARTTALVYPARERALGATLILAHGAGAGQHSAFMVDRARALASLGVDAVTFNFLYTEQRRRLPDPAPQLEACWRAVIAAVRADARVAKQALFIGGKSMGGRIATQVAASDAGLGVAGLVLLGYPLHPPGQPDKRRDAHLPAVTAPMLFVQGSRDTFGTPEELRPVLDRIGPRAELHVIDGGDHSFKRARAGADGQLAIYADIERTTAAWIGRVMSAGDTCAPSRLPSR